MSTHRRPPRVVPRRHYQEPASDCCYHPFGSRGGAQEQEWYDAIRTHSERITDRFLATTIGSRVARLYLNALRQLAAGR